MAGTLVGPGDCLANLSRRTFIGAATASALPLPLPASAVANLDQWADALALYNQAQTAVIRYAEGRLQPAWAKVQAGTMEWAEFSTLEDTGDRLGSIVDECTRALLQIPAPSAEALICKMEIAYEELFRHEADYTETFSSIMADAVKYLRTTF